jgi:16S rRNA (uracil1498-N3)-methyltransferase
MTLCQSLLKSQHMDLLVEKTSELGVDRVLPFISERTVVKGWRQSSGQAQAGRDGRSAAKQSIGMPPRSVRCPRQCWRSGQELA